MKKMGKALMLFILCLSIGAGGFILGRNTELIEGGADSTDRMQRIMQNLSSYKKTIDKDFLFEHDDDKLEAGIYKGLFAGLNDPYSEYYTADEYKRLMEDTSGKFAGVGLVITAGEDNLITVVSPIANTPAARAGIMANDKIVEVDGKSYAGSQLQEATENMRGEPGTKVDLTVQRKVNNKMETKHFTIEREMIKVESVVAKLLDNKIGYIQITSFDEETSQEFKDKWQELESQGAEKFVLDLRNNPGGLLSTCEEIADMLLGEGVIVTTVDNKDNKEVSRSDANQLGGDLVVLVNEGSASASEILTGALRDHKRAKSIGQKTFGKGIVQRLYPLGDNGSEGGFKLTMAEYLTPDGEKIHGKGIRPDIEVKLPDNAKTGPDHLDTDSQLKRAIEELNKESSVENSSEQGSESEASESSELESGSDN